MKSLERRERESMLDNDINNVLCDYGWKNSGESE